MNANENMNDLRPEQSWQKAEKMLDTHFRKRRIIIWSVSLFITGLVILSSVVLVNKFSANDTSTSERVIPNQPVNVSPGKKSDRVSVTTTASSPSVKQTANVKPNVQRENSHLLSNEKRDEVNSVNSRVEKRKSTPKSTTQFNPVVTTMNTNHVNHELKKSERKYAEVKVMENNSLPETAASNQVAFAVGTAHEKTELKKSEIKYPEVKANENNSPVSPVNEESKTDHSPTMVLPDLAYMDPIHISQIPVASAAEFNPVSRSEEKNSTLPVKKFDLKLSVYGASHYVSKKLESTNFKEYADRRKNEEEGIIASSVGASVSHAVRDFSISVGFEYSTWGEKNLYLPYLNKKSTIENGHYQDFNTVTIDSAYIWGNLWLIYDTVPDSTFISHLDSVTKSVYDESVYGANSINRFYFFEVPVELSYRFTHSKFGIGATVGISPAWLLTKKGYYLNKDVSGVELISDIKSINTFIVNGRFSLDLYYKMSERFNILLRPQFKANLNSIFKSDYYVSQRYYATGLVFGLQYSIR